MPRLVGRVRSYMTIIPKPHYKIHPYGSPEHRVFHAPQRATHGASAPRRPLQSQEGGGCGKPGPEAAGESHSLASAGGYGDAACNRAIKGHLRLEVYPGYVDLRQNLSIVTGKSNTHQRGKITTFSEKSRREYMKRVLRIPESQKPVLWQDFTVADDVMEGKTITERSVFAAETWHRFRKRVKRELPDVYIIARKEWQIRKSGRLIGQAIPHFHTFVGSASLPWDEICTKLAVMWVESTQTRERNNALKVALHPKSYRELTDGRKAMAYAMSYCKKEDKILGHIEESCGRAWMTIGKVPEADPEVVTVRDREETIVRRTLAKLIWKKRKKYRQNLRRQGSSSFVAVSKDTVLRIIQYAKTEAATSS